MTSEPHDRHVLAAEMMLHSRTIFDPKDQRPRNQNQHNGLLLVRRKRARAICSYARPKSIQQRS
jgi:hypothetical protein